MRDEDRSSQGAEHGREDAPSTTPGSAGKNGGELFADFGDGLRADLQFIHAALSFYDSTDSQTDVQEAWKRIIAEFRNFKADYLRLLGEKIDRLFSSAEGVAAQVERDKSRDEQK